MQFLPSKYDLFTIFELLQIEIIITLIQTPDRYKFRKKNNVITRGSYNEIETLILITSIIADQMDLCKFSDN